jgi:protein TonB
LDLLLEAMFCWPFGFFQGILAQSKQFSQEPGSRMSDLKSILPKIDRQYLANTRRPAHEDLKQRKLMLGSLCLLLIALGIALYHNRDFWFPDSEDADSDQVVETAPQARTTSVQPAAPAAKSASAATAAAKPKRQVAAAKAPVPAVPVPVPPAATATTTRTVLPPLDVEVVAGDSHRTLRPGNTSVRVDLQPGMPPRQDAEPGSVAETDTAANVTSNAAERIQMSANASDIVTHPVRPNYPLLARQMKVQGSVILQALIGKDGIIQNLRVVSGPHILASAAQDAVRQWHFKPHFEGTDAVETQAKITVNFTISTN